LTPTWRSLASSTASSGDAARGLRMHRVSLSQAWGSGAAR
jgi:hypothetical protein